MTLTFFKVTLTLRVSSKKCQNRKDKNVKTVKTMKKIREPTNQQTTKQQTNNNNNNNNNYESRNKRGRQEIRRRK